MLRDEIEESKEYKSIPQEELERLIADSLFHNQESVGHPMIMPWDEHFASAYWFHKKQVLKTIYHLNWKSPKELSDCFESYDYWDLVCEVDKGLWETFKF